MILAPSILAADFARLGEQLAQAQRGGASLVHIDVMDGHFVPNITVGPAVVAAVRRATSLPLDVHLMVQSPERLLDAFGDAGADWISVHAEATPHLQRCVAQLRGRGISPGIALNPSTPIAVLDEILPEIDYVLVMTVNPGFGGQAFLPSSLDKLRRLRRAIGALGHQVRIEVDGGVEAGNVRQLVDAGAEILVAGTSVFGGGDPEAAVRALMEAGTV